jgi:M6 family metalloprotease-like protein
VLRNNFRLRLGACARINYVGAIVTLAAIVFGSPGAFAAISSATDFSTVAAGSWIHLKGELQVQVVDHENSSETSYFLKLGSSRIQLHFAADPPTNFLSGAHVRVSGKKQSDGSLMLASRANVKPARGTSGGSTSTGPLPNTLGAQSTLVMLVNFQDDPSNQPYTVADAQNVVFGTASSFFLENSYNQTWLTGDVVGWYTIPVSSTSCDTSSIASYAQSAASAAGVNLSGYTHYVYAFPQNSNCGWGGLSNIGGSPGQSWINGTNGSGVLDTHIVAHEIGHQFGLYHSHLLDCGSSATICTNGSEIEYGDLLDTMGVPQTASPHYNAFQKERLGWLGYAASPAVTTVTSAGTYVINAYEVGGAGPNALKILKSADPTTGAKTWYYLEPRQAIGFDAFLTDGTCLTCGGENETDGVLFHSGTDGNGNSSNLLDMTPATSTSSGWFDPSLAVGQSFQDPSAGITVTTTWVASNQAAVEVQFYAVLTVAANQASYSPGQTVSLSATATASGAPAANVQVSFTITDSNGASVSGTAKTGSSGSAIYKLTLKRSAPSGSYHVSASATINGTATQASTSFTVL